MAGFRNMQILLLVLCCRRYSVTSRCLTRRLVLSFNLATVTRWKETSEARFVLRKTGQSEVITLSCVSNKIISAYNKMFQCEICLQWNNFISAGGSILKWNKFLSVNGWSKLPSHAHSAGGILHNFRHLRLLLNYLSEAAEIISVAEIYLFQHGTTISPDFWNISRQSYDDFRNFVCCMQILRQIYDIANF